MDSIENDDLEFPALFNKLSKQTVSLIKYEATRVLEDAYEQIEFVKQEGKDINKIILKSLSVGTYDLNLIKQGKIIKITVHKGEYWESDSFILKRNSLLENKTI